MSLPYFYDRLEMEDKQILGRALLNPVFVLLIQKEVDNQRQQLANVSTEGSFEEIGKRYAMAKLELDFWTSIDNLLKRNMKDVA